MVLIGSALIGIARRDRHIHAELGGEIEEGGDLLRRMAIEDGGIGVDLEAGRLGRPDRRNRAVEHPLLAHGTVMMLAQAIEMDREKQIGRRLEEMQLLLEKERIGA